MLLAEPDSEALYSSCQAAGAGDRWPGGTGSGHARRSCVTRQLLAAALGSPPWRAHPEATTLEL